MDRISYEDFKLLLLTHVFKTQFHSVSPVTFINLTMGMNSLDKCSGKIERLAYDYVLDFLVFFGCTYRPSFVAAACLIVASKMPIDTLSDQGSSFLSAMNASEPLGKNDGHSYDV